MQHVGRQGHRLAGWRNLRLRRDLPGQFRTRRAGPGRRSACGLPQGGHSGLERAAGPSQKELLGACATRRSHRRSSACSEGGAATATLVAVNVGLPQDVWRASTVHTGCGSTRSTAAHGAPAERGRRWQGDLAGHGESSGRARLPADSYRYRQAELHRDDFVHGQFGENFTVEDCPTTSLHRHRHRIGNAVLRSRSHG